MFEDPDSILLRQNPSLHTGRETALHYLQHFQRQIVQTIPNYKCVLCPRFEKYGFCRYSDFCVFAHGMDDLLMIGRTKLCTNRKCTKGYLCAYAHGENERLNLYCKTIICSNPFPCQFGENCSYAHTSEQIRNISDNIKLWKSSLKVFKIDVKQEANYGRNDWLGLNSSNTDWIAESNLNPNAVPFSASSDSLSDGSNSSSMSSRSTKFKTVLNNSDLNPNAVPFSSLSDSLSNGSNSSTISCSTKTDLNPNAVPFSSPKGKVFNRF